MASFFNLASWFNRSVKKQRQLQDTAQTFILEPIYTPSGITDGGEDGEGVELPPDNVIDDLDDSSGDTTGEDTTASEDSSSDSEEPTDDSEDSVNIDEEDTEELPYIDDIEAESESDTTESEFSSTAATEVTNENTADDSGETVAEKEVDGEEDTTSEDDSETDATSEDDTEETVAGDDSETDATSEDNTEETVAEDGTDSEETVSESESTAETDSEETVAEDDTSEDDSAETVAEDEVDGEEDTSSEDDSEETIAESDVDGETTPEDSEGETDTVAEGEVDEEADTEATAEDEELDEEDEEILDETPAFQLPSFDSGVFTVGDSGEVGVDFLYDGGKYQGDVGIFSLSGFDELELNSIEDFIAEAANRAASGSEQGHIVISDASEGAKFDGSLEGGEDWNSGGYRDVKTFTMKAGDKFAVMLVPDGSVSEVASNPEIGGAKRPLFSLSTANPNDEFHMNQLVDVTGDGNTFVMEDIRTDASSDKDYNDLIFQVRGATGEATYIGEVINAEDDWRTQDLGKALIAYTDPYVTPEPVEADTGESVDVTDGVEEVESESDEAVTDEASSVEVEDSQPGSEAEVEVTQAEDAQAETVDEIETETVDDTDVEVTDTVEETPTQEAQGETVDETDADTEQPATTTAETEATESDEGDLSEGFELGDEPQDTAESGFVPPTFEFPKEDQPDIGIIDTGVAANNPDLDYDNITLGTDLVDGDDNPLLAEGEGNEHGTHALGIIAAEQDNGEGIDGINDDAPIWVGRAVGSGKWAESLVEFVDHAKESGQPNAVVNLSMDLTQVDADGNVTTRYELTPQEREAIEYARQNNVMIVAAAGNDGGVMSALGQASQEFDNIMTVGAAEQFDPETSAWKGADRTNYSSYGQGLDVMAYGGTMENPQLSLAGEGTSGMAGTSVATAKVTGAVSQVWAANPELSYRQVVDIIRDTATDLGSTGDDAETGAGLLNMTAAVHLAKVTKPEEHSTPALLSPETWSGEGVFTPDERAVQHVNVTPEWRRQYHGWLDSSNPADTFSFQIDEPTSLQYSIDFPGNAVLRKNGQVVLTGKYDGEITYAGANGKLSPGSYTLTVDLHGLPVESYKLIMNFIDGSQGQQDPVVEFLPAKPVVQPQPTPTPTPQPTPSPSPEEVAAKKRAADKVHAVYEANRDRLGNSRRDIQIFEQAFDGVNMPAVQYFDGGYIIWNGQKAIPYFTGTGNALPNIELPSTVKPIWDVVKPSNVVKVPDGRHTYPNMRGSSEYWVELDGDKNDISLAARNTTLAHPDLRTTVYRDLGGGRLRQVPLTDINPDDNYLNYKDLPDGKYLIKVDVEQNKANVPYEMVVNLDQAGDTGIKAWNINRESVSGQLAGQRIVRSDHVGLPSGDRDLYVFTTDDMATELRFAVRSQDSDGSEAERQRLLDGDVRVRILDEGGKQIGEPIDSKSRQPLFGAQWLEPNSKYYAEVTALNGTKTNYDVVLNFNRLEADGRYEFTNLQGEFDYEFTVDGTSRQLYTAIRDDQDKNIPAAYYNSQLYRLVNGQWSKVAPNSTGNAVFRYDSLPQGHYRMEIEPKRFIPLFMPNVPYKFVHNLDQAGDRREDARNLGNIAGWDDDKRTVVKDHVGAPALESDFYKFKTDNYARVLQLAVRTGHDGTDAGPLDGDLRMQLLDKNGKTVHPKSVVSGKNSDGFIRSHYLKETPWASYDLEPNSEYFVKVEPLEKGEDSEEVNKTNYYLVVNAKESLGIYINGFLIPKNFNFYEVWKKYNMGTPTSEVKTHSSGAKFQTFDKPGLGKSLIVSSSHGTFPLYGGIGSYYMDTTGGLNGPLGAPKSAEYNWNGYTRQDFAGGYILWKAGQSSIGYRHDGSLLYPPTGGGGGGGSVDNPLLTRQNASYFSARPQFYTTGNIFHNSGWGSNLLGGGWKANNNGGRGTEGNCTWYAHGRVKELGGNVAALDSMWDDANEWHTHLSNGTQIVSSPRPGDIAQWTRWYTDSHGVRRQMNHVAVVEKVNGNGTIVISESHWKSEYNGSTYTGYGKGTLHNVRTIQANNPDRYIRVPGVKVGSGKTPVVEILQFNKTDGGQLSTYVAWGEKFNIDGISNVQDLDFYLGNIKLKPEFFVHVNGAFSAQFKVPKGIAGGDYTAKIIAKGGGVSKEFYSSQWVTVIPVDSPEKDIDYTVFDSILKYMHKEMKQNIMTPTAQKISDQLDAPFGVGYPVALLEWALMVKPGGEWDHKPDLQDYFDGDYYHPIRGDSKNEYYYDIWSNIHYGYVGKSVGFSRRTLQDGAAQVGITDISDITSIDIGINLWKRYDWDLTAQQLQDEILKYKENLSRRSIKV